MLQSAVGFEYAGKTEKHASQKGNALTRLTGTSALTPGHFLLSFIQKCDPVYGLDAFC